MDLVADSAAALGPVAHTAAAISLDSAAALGLVTDSAAARGLVADSVAALGLVADSAAALGIVADSAAARDLVADSAAAQGLVADSGAALALVADSIALKDATDSNAAAPDGGIVRYINNVNRNRTQLPYVSSPVNGSSSCCKASIWHPTSQKPPLVSLTQRLSNQRVQACAPSLFGPSCTLSARVPP